MILSLEKLQQIKPMSINNISRIIQIIKETEFNDFQDLVGTDIYNKLVVDVESKLIPSELQAILDAGVYQCITYLVYCNYIQEIGIIDTFTGIVQKNMTDSTPVPVGTIKNLVVHNRSIAEKYFSKVKDDLETYYKSETDETVKDGFSEFIGVRRGNTKCTVSIIRNW